MALALCPPLPPAHREGIGNSPALDLDVSVMGRVLEGREIQQKITEKKETEAVIRVLLTMHPMMQSLCLRVLAHEGWLEM